MAEKNFEDMLRELKIEPKNSGLELNLSDEANTFAVNRVLELDQHPYKELEKASKNDRAYQKLIKSTYYDSNPTYATRWVEQTMGLYREIDKFNRKIGEFNMKAQKVAKLANYTIPKKRKNES